MGKVIERKRKRRSNRKRKDEYEYDHVYGYVYITNKPPHKSTVYSIVCMFSIFSICFFTGWNFTLFFTSTHFLHYKTECGNGEGGRGIKMRREKREEKHTHYIEQKTEARRNRESLTCVFMSVFEGVEFRDRVRVRVRNGVEVGVEVEVEVGVGST